MDASPVSIRPFYDGWQRYNGRLVEAIRGLSREQLQLRPDELVAALESTWDLVSGCLCRWFALQWPPPRWSGAERNWGLERETRFELATFSLEG